MLDFELASFLLKKLEDEKVILVGGQAIELWRRYYNIETDIHVITTDIDFYGDSQSAEDAFKKLSGYQDIEIYVPGLDDETPNSGKLTFKINNEVIEIDYLYRVTGLSDDDIEQYSTAVSINDIKIRVLHPILIMESKIANLAAHPGKRNKEGIEQARLSVLIARNYLIDTIKNKGAASTYKLCERIGRFSLREPASFSFYQYKIDATHSIPIENYASEDLFFSKRYPQIMDLVNDKRQKFAVLMEKRKELLNDTDSMRYRL